MERLKLHALGGTGQKADRVEILTQAVKEERTDHLQDVLFARVVRPEVVPLRLVHHALEHRAEDRGRNLRPVERSAFEESRAHRGGERRYLQLVSEEVAVHVGERGNRLVTGRQPLLRRGVQHLKELGNADRKVAAVRRGLLPDEVGELIDLEDGRVLREEAEEESDEIDLQLASLIANGLERIVELRHLLGGLAVHGILFADFLRLAADHVTEERHVLAKVGKLEGRELRIFREIAEAERLEVGNDNGPRQGRLVGQGADIIHRLTKGRVEVLALRLHFNEDRTRPEAIDKALRAVRELHAMLKGRLCDGIDAEDLEEFLQERLGLRLLVIRALPPLGENGSRLANLVP